MRESAQSWKELLFDLKVRGLSIAPEIAVGDGVLGFWRALYDTFPSTRHQRCWQHKTLNVLDKLPSPCSLTRMGTCAKSGRRRTERRRTSPSSHPRKNTRQNDEKAVDCLLNYRDALRTFFDFPAEHWAHLRTSNPIESVFATVRHRTVA